MTSTARRTTSEMLYDELRSTARTLDEIWDAIDGAECEACEGTGEEDKGEPDGIVECETCGGVGTITTYEGQDAREYLEEMPLEIVWSKGEPFAVVLGTGGPHTEITGGGMASGTGYQLGGYWAGEHEVVRGEGVTRTGEYFREMVEEQDNY